MGSGEGDLLSAAHRQTRMFREQVGGPGSGSSLRAAYR